MEGPVEVDPLGSGFDFVHALHLNFKKLGKMFFCPFDGGNIHNYSSQKNDE